MDGPTGVSAVVNKCAAVDSCRATVWINRAAPMDGRVRYERAVINRE